MKKTKKYVIEVLLSTKVYSNHFRIYVSNDALDCYTIDVNNALCYTTLKKAKVGAEHFSIEKKVLTRVVEVEVFIRPITNWKIQKTLQK